MYKRAADVVVIGAGIVGLSIAWKAAQSGRTVTIVDPAPATGATYAAAGMLAPGGELHHGEEHLLELMLASAALYPDFVDSLGADRSLTGYMATRTVTVGADSADRQALVDLCQLRLTHGLSVKSLSVQEARSIEPMLGAHLSGAFLSEYDHQVDPRKLSALLESGLAATATNHIGKCPYLIRQNVVGLLCEITAERPSRVTGVSLADGSTITADDVIVANGLGADSLKGMPDWLNLPLRPVFGDIVRLRPPQHLGQVVAAAVRGVVRGVPLYLVPRSDGTVVLGATQRENGSAAVSAGGISRLLQDAQVIVPALAEFDLIEVTARARPGTPDNAPLLGRVSRDPGQPTGDTPGLVVATGFFRHGVLLAPVAAQVCVQLLDGVTDSRWHRFRPDRFSPVLSEAS